MENKVLHRRERLIIAAIEIIDELGIQSLSTREIARREGVSEATLFRHFKSKNELLLAVLEYYTKFDTDLFRSAHLRNLGPKESVLYIFRSYMEYYESYPAVTAIMQLFDVFRYEEALTGKVHSILEERQTFLRHIIDEAKRVNAICPNIDDSAFVDILWGACGAICLRWRVGGRNFSLKKKVISALEGIWDAFASV